MKDYLLANMSTYEDTALEFQEKKMERVPGTQRLVDMFAAVLPEQANVLELGMGSGQAAEMLAAKNYDVTGIEFSHSMAEVARQNAPDVVVVENEFLAHDFGTQLFDGIYAVAFIHLFPAEDARQVVRKTYKLLRPNGVALFATTEHPETREGYAVKAGFRSEQKRYRKEYTSESFQELFSSVGFELIKLDKNIDPTEADKNWVNLILRKPSL